MERTKKIEPTEQTAQMKGAIIITGASRGIGRAIALLAAKAGHDVCFTYEKDAASAAEVVAQIQQLGRKALALKVDLGDLGQVRELFNQVDLHFPLLHGLVNNAGIIGERGNLLSISAQSVQRVFEVNVLGLIECCRQFIVRVSDNQTSQIRKLGGSGGIVNLSSGSAQDGAPFSYIPYGASKAAVETFSIGLSKELGEKGIRVNVVSPGVTDTDIHHPDGQRKPMDAVAQSIAMRRLGQPSEIAEAVMWLLSDSASYVSGAVLRVAGGGRMVKR